MSKNSLTTRSTTHQLWCLVMKLRVYSWARNSLQNILTTCLLSSWNFPYCHVIVDFQIWTHFLSMLAWGSRIILHLGNSSFATWFAFFFFLSISLFLPFSQMRQSPSCPVSCSWTVAAQSREWFICCYHGLLVSNKKKKEKRTTSSVMVIDDPPALIIMHVKFFHTLF